MYSLLWIDDEPLAMRGIRNAMDFGRLGIDPVYEALDAEEAQQAFRSCHIDIMLCDIELPGESGLELAQWVNDHYPGTVIIFLTCHADFSYAQDAVRLMAFRYLLKPVSCEELGAVLSDAIHKQLSPSPEPQLSVSENTNVVEQTIAYIRANLKNPLTREELGRNVYLNSNYLARIFKEQTGQSFLSFITNLRLEQACVLLKTTHIPVSEISREVGIDDSSYFSRIFRRKYGMTPREYRNTEPGQAD